MTPYRRSVSRGCICMCTIWAVACLSITLYAEEGKQFPVHDKPEREIPYARGKVPGFLAAKHTAGTIALIPLLKVHPLNDEPSDEPDFLEVWRWNGGMLEPYPAKPSVLDRCINFNWLSNDRHLACYVERYAPSTSIMRSAKDGQKLYSWRSAKEGWLGSELYSSANGKYVGIASYPEPFEWKCLVSLLDVEAKRIDQITTFVGCGAFGTLAIPSNDGKHIAVRSGRHPQIINVAEKTHVLVGGKEGVGNSHNRMAFSPDGKTLYIACDGLGLEVVAADTKTGEIRSRWFATPNGQFHEPWRFACFADIDVSCDGKYVAVATVDFGDVFVRSMKTGKVTRLLHAQDEPIKVVSFSPEGEKLATFAAGSFKIWPRALWAGE